MTLQQLAQSIDEILKDRGFARTIGDKYIQIGWGAVMGVIDRTVTGYEISVKLEWEVTYHSLHVASEEELLHQIRPFILDY